MAGNGEHENDADGLQQDDDAPPAEDAESGLDDAATPADASADADADTDTDDAGDDPAPQEPHEDALADEGDGTRSTR